MKSVLRDKASGQIVAEVKGAALTFDETARLGGLEWRSYPEVECDGWYDADGVLWDESVAKVTVE